MRLKKLRSGANVGLNLCFALRLLTYAKVHFLPMLLCRSGAGPTVFFKRRLQGSWAAKIEVNYEILTPSFIIIRSGIVTVIILFR